MSYATQLALLLTTWEAFELEFATRIREITDRHRERLEEITLQFLLQGVSPTAAFELETAMAEELRELGREWVEMLYNMIEAEDAESMPHDVTYQGNGYRRLNRKTRNAHVANAVRNDRTATVRLSLLASGHARENDLPFGDSTRAGGRRHAGAGGGGSPIHGGNGGHAGRCSRPLETATSGILGERNAYGP